MLKEKVEIQKVEIRKVLCGSGTKGLNIHSTR